MPVDKTYELHVSDTKHETILTLAVTGEIRIAGTATMRELLHALVVEPQLVMNARIARLEAQIDRLRSRMGMEP